MGYRSRKVNIRKRPLTSNPATCGGMHEIGGTIRPRNRSAVRGVASETDGRISE